MATVPTIQPYLPIKESLVQPDNGQLTIVGLAWFQQQASNISTMAAFLNTVIGVNTFTVATQPSLGVSDAGFIGWLTDYKHTVRWTGTAWEFFGDSQNGFFADFAIVPQTGLWQLCDGTTTHYLTLGVTLTETSFTVPDLISTPAYRKAIAAYTGTINAKVAPSATGTSTTGTGTTSTDGSHNHGGATGSHQHTQSGAYHPVGDGSIVSGQTVVISPTGSLNTMTVNVTGSVDAATASIATDGSHSHTVPALSVPALTIGSIEMANLGCLPYFRC